jgi:hypothetical protein
MILTHEEFIRRFTFHILPKHFVKIRHYDFLSSIPIEIETGNGKEKIKGFTEKTKGQNTRKSRENPFSPKCA